MPDEVRQAFDLKFRGLQYVIFYVGIDYRGCETTICSKYDSQKVRYYGHGLKIVDYALLCIAPMLIKHGITSMEKGYNRLNAPH